MKLGELIDAFRWSADDTATPPFWSDARLIALFNEAENEAAMRAGLLLDVDGPLSEYEIRAGDTVLDLDPRLVTVKAAWLVTSDGRREPLALLTRDEATRLEPDWRTLTGRPDGLILTDTQGTLNRVSDAAYTLKLEATRLPLEPMRDKDSTPKLAAIHHPYLLDWVFYRAYDVQDAEIFNPKKSAEALVRFERYFGRRPTAAQRKAQQANRPHRNQPCW